ncbi:peptidylprolyl isomerase [Colwellia psychrerythraea]|uniref:Peptidyl-prolyl cis-trans isomerase n=1 Tax=Colwellia psychrerythraea TaxID=28229 RepID=A0A099KZB7_COLPS|nr:peptidylprolyl isomerase [Colwellia psychrerythraea]KGJ94988.1 peptidyl-prolyl cis-trans isomerase cyclophilin type [Colwellia psychrerythraea]
MLKKITKKNTTKLFALIGIVTASFSFINPANATIVEFQTSQGNFQVNLFDTTTPKTVSNFLSYVNDEHYTNSVVHRVAKDFVVQAGGYEFSGEWPLTPLVASASVINEPVYSNVKGTIAMAKQGGNPNSATNQWFFNLEDNNDTSNPDNLDRQNGGFTAFGQVIGDGMLVVEKIALLDLCTAGSLQGVPMVIDDNQTCADMTVPGMENFVVIERITIIDNSEVTDADLHPLLSKYPDSDGDGVKDIDDAFPSDPSKSVPDVEDSGGSFTWFSLMVLALVSTRKRFIKS